MTPVVIELRGRTVSAAVAQSLQAASTGAMKVEVLLSGALARPFVFGPVAGLRGWIEGHAAARAAAAACCGIDDPCEVRLEDDPSSAPTLASAVATATLEALYAAAGSTGVRVKSVRPLWAWALERLPRDARLPARAEVRPVVICDADSQTLLVPQGSRCLYAATQFHTSVADQDLLAWLRRVQLACAFDAGDLRAGFVNGDPDRSLEPTPMSWTVVSNIEAGR